MNYRNNNGNNDLSILGFGCMRFTKKGNSFDMEAIEKQITYAVEHGVNYFDTAYIYPGCEDVLGRVVEKYGLRDKITIATKLPHYFMKTREDMEKNFAEQLRRLRTDYVDNYLMHMLPDVKTWNALIERGVLDFLKDKIEKGQIKKVGFSYHGSTPIFLEILNAYDWDFCQIQYNYMDETSQAGVVGLKAAAEKKIPVIIMEPLRGGRLVNDLPEEAVKLFESNEKKYSPAEWALRWLWNQPEVSVVLSGMNSMEMLEENIRIAEDVKVGEFTDDDFAFIDKIKAAINAKIKVPCTGCSYCMPCPFGVDIPGSFRFYNMSYTDNYVVGFKEYFMCTGMKDTKSNAGLCRECGKCEQHCPQNIPIRKQLKNVKKRFENPIFKLACFFTKGLYKDKQRKGK